MQPDSCQRQIEAAEDEIWERERQEEGRRRVLPHVSRRQQDDHRHRVAQNSQSCTGNRAPEKLTCLGKNYQRRCFIKLNIFFITYNEINLKIPILNKFIGFNENKFPANRKRN